MPKLVHLRLDDGTDIYMEATEDVEAPAAASSGDRYDDQTSRTLISLGTKTPQAAQTQAVQSFKAIESTIRTYTHYTMNAFRDMASANVEKVTLEFGLKVGGEAGVPYITKGTAESNLKITVECSFKDR